MAEVKTPIEAVSCQIKTGSGKESAKRGIDPKATIVFVGKEEIKVRSAVTSYAQALKKKKDAEKAAADASEVLRTYVGAVRDENAKNGDYQKTFRVLGNKGHITEDDDSVTVFQYASDVSQNDKFSIGKKEIPAPTKDDPNKMGSRPFTVEELKAELGTELFDKVMEEETTIAIKKEVLTNKAKRIELSKLLVEALGKDGIKEYFTKDIVAVFKKDVTKNQYDFSDEETGKFSKVASQSLDTVKALTDKIE